MSRWSDIYNKKRSLFSNSREYVNYKMSYKKALIDIVEKYSLKENILEVGCGTGATCIYLALKSYQIVGIDSDKDMLEMAGRIAEECGANVRFVEQDLRDLYIFSDKQFDVVFSNGVMEHFDDSQLVHCINEQLRVAKTVVISVPSSYFSEDQRIYGDERFMDQSKWLNILRRTVSKFIETTGYDLHGNEVNESPAFHVFICR